MVKIDLKKKVTKDYIYYVERFGDLTDLMIY